ncbi:hypothetical protein [Homoserinimonas sp. A520]
MTDSIDDRLAAAGRVYTTSSEVASVLSELADARASAARSSRKRRVLVPSISIGVALAVSGAGAVVATQWHPWEMTDPDIVVARDWTDGNGTFLGSCETRLAAHSVAPEALEAMRHYLDTSGIDNLRPNPEIVAAGLLSVGRPDDLGRLIPGAVASDYDVSHSGEPWSSEWYSDARILQDGLMHEVFTRMSQEAYATQETEDGAAILANSGISAQLETQCTTDPPRSAEK